MTLTDENGGVLHESVMSLEFLDSEITAAEKADAAAIALFAGKAGRLDARNALRNLGKGRVVHEISKAAGFVFGKRVEAAVRCHFGMGL